jgi:hypothetical protein
MGFGKMVVAQCNVGHNIMQATFCEANISTSLIHLGTRHGKGFFESTHGSFSTSIALMLLKSCTANQKGILVRASPNQFRNRTLGIPKKIVFQTSE